MLPSRSQWYLAQGCGTLPCRQEIAGMDIRQYLREQTREARFDSSGSFTLDLKAAYVKLAAYQLPRPSLWLVKMVQAAVAADSPELIVQQKRDQTHVFFAVLESFDFQVLVRGLQQPIQQPCRFLDHLWVGLRALGGQQRTFRLKVTLPTEVREIEWDGETVHTRCWARNSQACLFHLQVDDVGDRAHIRCAQLLEATELKHNAHACPIPITMDGLRVDNFEFMAGDRSQVGNSLLLLATDPPGSGCLAWSIPQSIQNRRGWSLKDSLLDSRPYLLRNACQSRLAHIWALRLGYEVIRYDGRYQWGREYKQAWSQFETRSLPSLCYWVYDGAIVAYDDLRLPQSPLGLTLYLSAQDLRVDLSGFQVHDSHWKLRQRRILSALPYLEKHLNCLQITLLKRIGGLLHGAGQFVNDICTDLPARGTLIANHADRKIPELLDNLACLIQRESQAP